MALDRQEAIKKQLLKSQKIGIDWIDNGYEFLKEVIKEWKRKKYQYGR